MNRHHVTANATDFGIIWATDEQEARDLAAQTAGYLSEADMVDRLEQPSEIVAELVNGDATLSYEPMPGTSIDAACREVVRLAEEHGETVGFDFNGITIEARAGQDPAAIAKEFYDEMRKRREEYLASPEYAQQVAEAEEARKAREREATALLAAAPGRMTMKDSDAWAAIVSANTDPYGAATVAYADRWARMMEAMVAQGASVAECSDECSHIADTDGISGAMFGFAKGALRRCWVYGDQL